MNSKACPRCGQKVGLQPHPRKPGRVVAVCACRPGVPFYESDAPQDWRDGMLSDVPEVTREQAMALFDVGIRFLGDADSASDTELAEAEGVGAVTVRNIRAYIETKKGALNDSTR